MERGVIGETRDSIVMSVTGCNRALVEANFLTAARKTLRLIPARITAIRYYIKEQSLLSFLQLLFQFSLFHLNGN